MGSTEVLAMRGGSSMLFADPDFSMTLFLCPFELKGSCFLVCGCPLTCLRFIAFGNVVVNGG